MALGYVLDDLFALHQPPGPHPERPARIVAVRDALRDAGLERRGQRLATRPARDDELGLVHTGAYVGDMARALPGQSGWLDPDTYFGPRTWDAALAAAGGAIDLARAVLDGQVARGLALVRPPGHHAEPDQAMGFCLFNNAALAAAAARAAGAARVCVLDWDVHHGNGTQHAFEADPSVMYLSVHQFPFYPGTGAAEETGTGEGRGTTVNVGMPAGAGDADVLAAFDRVLIPALVGFAPDLVVVSAGFDAHRADPLAGLDMTEAGYRQVARRVVAAAEEVAGGRVVTVLEGGYDLGALSRSLVAVVEVMEGRPAAGEDVTGGGAPAGAEILPEAARAIERTRAAHRAAGAAWAAEVEGVGP